MLLFVLKTKKYVRTKNVLMRVEDVPSGPIISFQTGPTVHNAVQVY